MKFYSDIKQRFPDIKHVSPSTILFPLHYCYFHCKGHLKTTPPRWRPGVLLPAKVFGVQLHKLIVILWFGLLKKAIHPGLHRRLKMVNILRL